MSLLVNADPTNVNDLIRAIAAEPAARHWNFQLKATTTGQALLNLSPAEQKLLVLGVAKHLTIPRNHSGNRGTVMQQIINELWRKRLPFTHDELVELLASLAELNHRVTYIGIGHFVRQVSHFLEANPCTEQLASHLQHLIANLEKQYSTAEMRKYIVTLKGLAGTDADKVPLLPGEAWSDHAIGAISHLPSEMRQKWLCLFAVLQEANGGSPTAKWQKAATAALEKLGYQPFKEAVVEWFPLVDKPRTLPAQREHNWQPDPSNQLIDANADLLRAMAWLCADKEDRDVARALTTLALSAYRKIPGVGPRCVRVGNACVWALGHMPGMQGVYQLAVLKAKVKFGTAQIGIEKALTAAAEREQLPRAEIEELSTPTYGLTAVGLHRETLGEFTAELQVTAAGTELHWFKADGKAQKSVPQAVKSGYAEELKELQQSAKDLQKMLPVLRERIDNLFLARKSWALESWQERYLDHPLMGIVARRLIWRFTTAAATVDGLWHEGQLIDCHGQPLPPLAAECKVSLWHPIDAAVETITAWRTCLEEREIQQPFKQAHREIYLLTDAERNTQVYSNRFAAHILKQHQFNGLCALRNWRNKLRLMVDDTYPPATKELPEWGLRAEFWIEGIGDNYGTDTNEAGVYLRVATDQVRFYQLGAAENYAHAGGGGYGGRWGLGPAAEPVPLEAIPPLVLSEIMRDVDLFVGVASVGNDPTWQDGGPQGRYRNYWVDYAFGELGASAATRKAVLERLIPKLKIAKRCDIQDRFLVVRGDLRTYKIHLGSSNILMEPNDQYLCIVPGRSAEATVDGKLFLPFEGDRTLTIILSKAFLLADDKSIKDETILRQLRR
ncbi:MAG: DUF4132 domain-containing protein [Caldilinea sp. CFX5]|nr:DUF4132 domain-containing protein [Caldilinea sp. CFX5]